MPDTAPSDASTAAAAAAPVVPCSPVDVGDLVLICRKDPKTGLDFTLPGIVSMLDLTTQLFQVETLIDDGDEHFEDRWCKFEPMDGWDPSQGWMSASVCNQLKDHTIRLNPKPAETNAAKPQTRWIETSKGQLAIQTVRQVFVKLSEQEDGRVSGMGLRDLIDKIALRDLIDKIANPACVNPVVNPKPRSKNKKRRRSGPEDARAGTAHTGGPGAGRSGDEVARSPCGSSGTNFENGQSRAGGDGSRSPKLERPPDTADRRPTVDHSSIEKQKSLVRMLGATLEKEMRNIPLEASRLVSYSFNPVNITQEGDEVAQLLQYGEQILHAAREFRTDFDYLYHDLEDTVRKVRACNEKYTRGAALLCTEQRQAAQRELNEADKAVSRAFLSRHQSAQDPLTEAPGLLTKASQRLEAARRELDRLTEKERQAKEACGKNVGPSSH
jgi:hypothetical protein